MSLLTLFIQTSTVPYTSPYVIDYSNDYEFVDGIEEISLTPQNPTGAEITGISAVRSTVDRKEKQQFASIGTNTGDVLFVIYLATTSTEPVEGDLITDDEDVDYIVNAVRTLADLGQARTFCSQVQT
ncbi:MAG: hypothetical protein HN975_02040 [Anaerolineae bacterium]|jgi:hypothetical protein|nr:hypothetical protein [Anaerolineae bacterium]